MKRKFKLTAISFSVMMSLGPQLHAQEVKDEEKDKTDIEVQQQNNNVAIEQDDEIEIIEVQGFKSSLQKSINAKRFSDGVTDSIHAEDVGKSTDQNIADALSRVTGVTVQEEAGEGTRVSIRGAGPSLNQISMNGVALTGGLSTDGSSATATNDNSVDLSTFSSDILSSIDVLKTAAADQDEGSLGGTVVLNTVKPLRLNKPRRSFTAEGRYNEFSSENDYRLNASYADKFLDDTFGFVITATKDKQKTREDRINTNWLAAIPIDDFGDTGGRIAYDNATGNPIRVLGYQRDAEGQVMVGDDGNPLLNPIESLLDYDPSSQTLHEGDLFVLARNFVDFTLSTSERDRFSLSTGLQYAPTSNLDIQLDLTHTTQEVLSDYHQLRLNMAPLAALNHPADYLGVDLTTNTLQTSRTKSTAGNFVRANGLREIETDVATLKLDYVLTDNLSMDMTLGYSKTSDETPDDDEDDRFISMSTNTWGTAGREVVMGMPDEIWEPVGYDCANGNPSQCSYSTGITPGVFDALDGSATYVTSRFNPFDMQHNHLGSLVFRKNRLEDENKSVFVNFEYLFDSDYVRSVQFGGKWANRSKQVSIQNRITTNGEDLIALDDPNADFEVRGMASIRLADMLSGDAFPYDNFGEDIQQDRSAAFFGGWPLLDAEKALELLAGKDASEVGLREDISGTRDIETDTIAAYFKVNFEGFGGRLNGNLGLRYVRDETTATGVGGINFIRAPQVVDPYNLLVERGLANMNLDACPDAIMGVAPSGVGDVRYTPQNEAELSNCWAWQITHAYNRQLDNTIPWDNVNNAFLIPGADGQVGPDVNRLVFTDENGNITQNNPLPALIYDQDGNLVQTNAGLWARFGIVGHIWPFLDRTTTFTGPQGSGNEVQNRTAFVTNDGENDVFLPSLNINYAINEEMIGRFAVSRTMTRPRFDSLNPRTQITESQWGISFGSAGNTQLKPLTSTNIDVSYEWYFNQSGLLSVALFYKDMQDFEEQVVIPYHYRDVRTEYDLQSADLLLPFDENRTPGDADDCMPRRYTAGFFDQWNIECDVVNVNTVINSKGADIRGLEVGYTQNYDFLPGLLSGLGASVNFTYQDSERDVEEIGTTGLQFKPLPQPYTPKYSSNTTLFWEKDGISLRLAHRFNDVQLVSQGAQGGATWQDATHRLDFSSNFKLTENLTLTFQALNLTDDLRRVFFASSNTTDLSNPNDQTVVLDEGNVIEDDSITTARTVSAFRTGRQFRLGIRGTF
ncbi:TonB-dependent receptor domain-containing protein [Aestuariibacter sp. A3R04]|uniref:TonB-dependent receptor domain-containing protein n=1 Tax=Aestuariibacter sp. A3R04 TaxID=2841571 RepID=UPI001C096C8A|nr:TonB-dependent receptor [Aestuariibacter sp. A3R04]MBU3021096.1 TonB-dependent receptor [Aestuariibacter sp. A3R04]